MYKKVLLTWVLFIPIAIINGIIREALYEPYVGDLLGHQISTGSACAAFLILSYLMLHKEFEKVTNRVLVLIGGLWVMMTILFEFGFGHYVDGASWKALLNDYNLLNGRLWLLFLVFIFITPFIIRFLKERRSK